MKKRIFAQLVIVAAVVIGSSPAYSDDDRYSLSAAYKEECGSCHVAYPPQLLPASSWNALMAGLDKHFGTDASLDKAKAREIADYLAGNAPHSERKDGGYARLRITETPWFKREHRDGHDGLAASVWKSAAVRSPANCGACHPKASDGNYREDEIRIPRIR